MSTVYNIDGAVISEYNTPQAYGGVADGVTNCSTAIEALLAANIGGTVYFPEGVYAISRPIKTYPYYDKGVNIIFHNSATVIPIAEMEFMLDIGGLSQDANSSRGKKIITGGRFETNDGLVTGAAIHINTKAANVDLSNMTIMTTGCSGIIVGEEGVSGSTDAYLHNLYIRHGNEANVNSGILFYADDNNVSDCRVYYYGINLNCKKSVVFCDIHTLANGVANADQISLLAAADVYLTNYYADSEDTFIRVPTGKSPCLFLNTCMYFSYKSNNVVLFDLTEKSKLKVNGLSVTCRANTEYTGIKMPYSAIDSILSPSAFDIDGLQIKNPQYMKNGDPLKGMRTNDNNTSFYPTAMATGTWYLIGALAVNDTNSHSIKIRSDKGITEIPVSIKCTSAGTLSADTASGKIITTDGGIYQIGYKLINTGFDSASEYPLVNIYIKRVSGGNRTLYRLDMESNLMARISPNGEYTGTIASSTDTPDIICNVDCDSETVSVVS